MSLLPMPVYFVDVYERNLFETRYRNPDGGESTWEDLFERVATTVAGNDPTKYDLYNDAMCATEFIPSSPQLWNYGTSRRNPKNGSSCFTLIMGDTLESFREADADAEKVYVASGGAGLLANTGRPRGTKIQHCSEGAMGTMCAGGPIRRIEGTTGYITGSGRARGALMWQLSVWHPDAIEFILAKRPTSLGWLDNWVANAGVVTKHSTDPHLVNSIHGAIDSFSAHFVGGKDWPTVEEAERVTGMSMGYAEQIGIIKIDEFHRAIPYVTDWNTTRPANRDWDLPLQNCNMSIRVTDAFMRAVESDGNWAFSWFDMSPPKSGQQSWTKTDVITGVLSEHNGPVVVMSEDQTMVNWHYRHAGDAIANEVKPYRYGVVITTWEGLRANMSPNQNQWRDTDYARFCRNVLDPALAGLTGPIKARQVWNIICENAWNHADPGVIFEDTYERYQPVDSAVYGPRLSNPCSEYVNSGGGSCNLASVNLRLASMVAMFGTSLPQGTQTSFAGLQWYLENILNVVSDYADKAIEYITDALEYNEAPVEYIDRMTREDFRTVGVGMMGLAELLMMLHVPYGSQCAESVAACVMSEIALTCWERSFRMVREGHPVPKGWDAGRMEYIFLRRTDSATKYELPESHADRWHALAERARNGECATHTCVTSVAPTGTIAQVASWQMTRAWRAANPADTTTVLSVTSGVEPTMAWAMGRQDNSGSINVYHDLWVDPEHHKQPWMLCASEVSPEGHIRMQAAVCAFTCMSVSKTVNMDESATVEDVKRGYELAWKLGVPGTAIYRDRSKPMQVLTKLECPSGECMIPTKG